jgi:hypothetical protein
MGQPMSSHVDSSQAALFKEIDFLGQGRDVGEFERSRFLTPSPLEFRESAYKGREARFMVFAVEPCSVQSSKRSLHRKIKEVVARAGLKTHTPNNLTVSGTRLIF